MATAIAAVGSVGRILGQILQHQHFIVENKEEVESLFNQVTSLEVTLRNSNSYKSNKHIASLESQLVNAAYRARHLIETHIEEQFIPQNNLVFSSYELFDEARKEIGGVLDHVQPIIDSPDSEMKDDVITLVYDKLLPSSEFQRVCVVGRAGTGKTTLTRHVFNDIVVKQLFEIRGWVTVSQSHDMRQILIDILDSIPQAHDYKDTRHENTTQQLQQHLYNALNNTRYLIVLDDLCAPQVLDDLSPIFPDDENASRILVTTRSKDVANCFDYSYLHWMTAYKQVLRCQQLVIESRGQVEFLLNQVNLLHRIILQNSSGKSAQERKSLENQIINAENRAKDFSKYYLMEYKFTFSPQCLTEVKGEIDLANQLVIEIVKEAQHMNSLPGAASSIPPTPARNITGHDFQEIKNKLAEQSSKLEVVSLFGMGGIGKTTLAKQVYYDKFFSESFPVCAWVTISQSYDLQKVLSDLLHSMKKDSDVVNDKSTIADLSERLYKSLKGWKYLIIIDDVWDTRVWDYLRRLFPDDSNGSRILLTTRLENVAVHANSCLHHVHFMNEDESWNLFCWKVFGEDSCPHQLEEIGKQIVRKCQGLPLAIVVIGGLFFRATRKARHWRNVCESLSSSNGNDHCLQILSLSYTNLCDHMKKCFLYVGIFPEDSNILVSKLVKKWVAEGFLESQSSNRLIEDIAYETLLDLIGRNLLLVDGKSSTGKVKRCKIHDVVRDFCIREAKREMLFHITDVSLYGILVDAKVPILSIHPSTTNIIPCDYKKLSSLHVSSLHIFDPDYRHSVHHINREPLRVLDMGRSTHETCYGERASYEFLSCKNLVYVSSDIRDMGHESFIPSSPMLPELQTLILRRVISVDLIEFPNIWNMAQLRHVEMTRLCLSDLVEGENSGIILENLQTLSEVYNFRWSKEVLKRIPNMRKLGIRYDLKETVDWQHYCLQNLSFLQKLEALTLICSLVKPCPSLLHICSFPPSLKKLTLEGCCIPWKDMKIIGLLPNLEVLKLRKDSFAGKEWEWESTEEEFPKLKYLLLSCLSIELWRADSVSFPRLQRLIIIYCLDLKEIPHCIGELPTLQLIQLQRCCDSLNDLVKEMREENIEFGYDGFDVQVTDLLLEDFMRQTV